MGFTPDMSHMSRQEKAEHAAAVEADHDAYIGDYRDKLETAIKDALGQTGNALYDVRHLSSDQVYDVEYAEGGDDVQRLLELAQAALAGAGAIVRERNYR